MSIETPLLDQINTPHDLRQVDEAQLPQVADELRLELIYVVSQTGGLEGLRRPREAGAGRSVAREAGSQEAPDQGTDRR